MNGGMRSGEVKTARVVDAGRYAAALKRGRAAAAMHCRCALVAAP